jgi:hypothetical protein
VDPALTDMQTHPKKLLVIIAESAIERLIVRDARRLGANGYTVTDVRGGGAHGDRDADWEGNRSVRVEVIGEQAICDAIAQHVLQQYCPNYAVSMYVVDCGVLRPHKF